MCDAPVSAVGVVGLGVIGGSLARALVARGVRVLGTARAADDARRAAACGVEVHPDAGALAAALPAGSAVVLAVPLGALAEAADLLLARVDAGALVLHATGLQRADAAGLRPTARARVLGTHPMAGSHELGFGASRPDLFAGATVWAEARADATARARLEWLWAAAGAAAVRYARADEHDALMAWVSHLPQLAATALAGALADAGVPAGAGGPGLRDVTRLAASPLPLWRDVLAAAPPETDAALAALGRAVDELRGALRAGRAGRDPHALDAAWARAQAWRSGTPPGEARRAGSMDPAAPRRAAEAA